MDGMVQSEHPIIVMGATNAPLESLDPAMLRPGRLSRHVQVALPDLKGRQGLFDYYGKKYKLSSEAMAHLNTLAKNSFGFSGADIENILNEAAMLTARNNLPSITPAMLEEAVDRVSIGNKRDLKMPQSEKENTAYHEIGHAIVGHFLERNKEIKKITILPRGKTLGVTWSQPNHEYDVVSKTKEDYINEIAMAFGGRLAEEIIYKPKGVTSGAYSDLEAIRGIAEDMVWKLGWSGFSPRNFSNSEHLSEGMKQRLEKAVDEIVALGEKRARDKLWEQYGLLKAATQALLTYETLDKDAFEALVNKHGREPSLGNKIKGFCRRHKLFKVKENA
jgi:cell division protease FtsH